VASRHLSLLFQCITKARLVHPTDLEDYSCRATQVTSPQPTLASPIILRVLHFSAHRSFALGKVIYEFMPLEDSRRAAALVVAALVDCLGEASN